MTRGLAATGSERSRWLERAHRLAPQDATVTYALASALCSTAPDRALLLLARIPPLRHVLVSRLVALSALERHDDAAETLDSLLLHFAPPAALPFRHLADRVCAQGGLAGWVGVSADGTLSSGGKQVTLWLGAQAVPPAGDDAGAWCLPAGWRRAASLISRSPRGRVAGGRIDLARRRQVRGHVGMLPGRVLGGWAAAPQDPDYLPEIEVSITPRGGAIVTARADGEHVETGAKPAGQRGRAFRIPLPDDLDGPEIHVRARSGQALAGSPVRLVAEARAARADVALAGRADPWRPLPVPLQGLLHPEPRAVPGRRPLDILVVAGDAGAATIAALRRDLCDATAPGTRVLLAGRDGTARRLGGDGPGEAPTRDPASARDVLVLSGSTRLPPGAIERLAASAYQDAWTGTVTPLNTDGSLTSRLGAGNAEARLSVAELASIDSALQDSVNSTSVLLPTCGTACVYLRHDCLAAIGPLRSHLFDTIEAQLTDFAQRAAQAGWRHRAAGNVIVSSPGPAVMAPVNAWMSDAGPTLERLHPGLAHAIAAWTEADPLRPIRFALDAKLWDCGRRARATILVTHDSGGGVERHVAARVETLRAAGHRAIVVRPKGGFAVSDGTGSSHPNLLFGTVEALAAFLGPDRPIAIELHHIAAHERGVARLSGLLKIPFDVYVHDFAAVCPRVTLCGGDGQYCGEPADAFACEDCIADSGPRIPLAQGFAAYRAEQAMLYRLARRIVAPTHDAAGRIRRFVSRVDPVVEPWEDDAILSRPAAHPEPCINIPLHVAVVGAIGDDKGYRVLLACARDAARRGLPLHFTVVGHTIDDARLLATDRVFITGPFAEGEAPALVRGCGAQLGFLPSIWPETWCYALSSMWQAGLQVLAFDLGGQAERIRRSGAGSLIPPGTPAADINDSLLAWAGHSRVRVLEEPRISAREAVAA